MQVSRQKTKAAMLQYNANDCQPFHDIRMDKSCCRFHSFRIILDGQGPLIIEPFL